MDCKEIAIFSAKMLDEKKAQDVMVIDIGEQSSFADYFVLATGSTERQISALRDDIESKLAKEGLLVKSIEGKQTSGWILMDYGDVIVNILTPEMRERYSIEKVWGDCKVITFDE